MNEDIVIIGSGFAARQLIKNLRKLDDGGAIRVIADDSCDEYHKPELSHVISQRQSADDLTRMTAGEFAEQFRLALHSHSRAQRIDAVARRVYCDGGEYAYRRLILATGAQPMIPAIEGRELMLTLNSQQQYRRIEDPLRQSQRVLLLGAGLIGTELAMDLARAGKQVILVDQAASILASLMPAEVSARLQHCLVRQGVELMLNSRLLGLYQTSTGLVAALPRGRLLEVDAVIAAIGLKPDTALAGTAGLDINKGIRVDDRLRTSDPSIYALGDCAEINGALLPFLQPIQLGAAVLAKNLLGGDDRLVLPPMLVKVKTPDMPLHLAGQTQRTDLRWQINFDAQGIMAQGWDGQQRLRAFVAGEARMKEAFLLLRQLEQ
ncbi:NADH:flavorubredoxin reductase NorW [Acerihabitans arboris]|uniref:NADH:flavorubredoxin reductase NorW n=1 Tax=Acerihabitans arboris TaxID=2691583 RepID=A0A845SLW1_9GAMM|nr:NADH:flavorubredoxin reductase NorW [Acerihabitans arboris]NDL63611.1 NADH:flavorubredoxin reductase NorW [Acerihabitans arboris]